MKPSKPYWVEEPIWPPEDFESLAKLRKATGVPLAMGENATSPLDFRKMIAAGAVRLRAAQRHQDRRHHQLFRDRDRGREGRRHLRAACVLFRPGLSGDACTASPARSATRRSSACSPMSPGSPIQDRAGRERRGRGARPARPRRRPGRGHDREIPRLRGGIREHGLVAKKGPGDCARALMSQIEAISDPS